MTYNELNHLLKSFQYLGADASSKICKVPANGEKLGGQAVENWCLIRLLPIILFEKVKKSDDPVWQLFLCLYDIVEIVCAPQINETGVAVWTH